MPKRKYSDALLEEAAYLREEGLSYSAIGRQLGISPDAAEFHCLRLGADSPKAARRKPHTRNVLQYTRAGRVVRRFTKEEDALLLRLEAEGLRFVEIARRMGRKSNSIQMRLRTLARQDARHEARSSAGLTLKDQTP